ncbi:MAG: hypothetical protein E7268_02230 [Lachnospiraceae bacterium]|nr:hypothetical protein [Lachnospiraceae bacterium]
MDVNIQEGFIIHTNAHAILGRRSIPRICQAGKSNNRVTGWVDLHSYRMEVMLMKNQNKYDFKDLLSFGLFILALLTFVFTFCK